MGFLSSMALLGAGAAVNELGRRLLESRPREGALSERLGWCTLVAPGVVMQKDGSFLFGWEFEGPDRTGGTPLEQNLTSRMLNRAWLPFTDQWIHHLDLVRVGCSVYPPTARTAPRAARVVDGRLRTEFGPGGRKFRNRQVLVTTWLAPADAQDRLSRALLKGEELGEEAWRHHVTTFLEAGGVLEDRLSVRLRMRRMTSARLLSHLYFCLAGVEHPVLPPEELVPLDCLLAPGRWQGGTHPMVGDRHVRVVTWTGFPRASTPGLLDSLQYLPFSYRWSTRLIPLGMAAAEKAIEAEQITWFHKRKKAGQLLREARRQGQATDRQAEDDAMFENSHARLMALQAKEAAAANASGDVRYGHYDAAVVIHDPSERRVEARARAAAKHLGDLGFTVEIERVNCPEALFASCPGNGSDNIRRPLLSTRNAVDLSPIHTLWQGLDVVPNQLYPAGSPSLARVTGKGGTPLWFTPFNRDVGHTLVFGSTGSGKSTLISYLMTMFMARYADAGGQAFGFDKGDSAFLTTSVLDGAYHSLRVGDPRSAFQPLAHLDRPGELAWALEWLETMAELQGAVMNAELRECLRTALEAVAGLPRPMRTITSLLYQLQDRTKELERALEPYAASGPYGGMFDATTEEHERARVETTEMFHVRGLGDKLSVPVMTYRFHRLQERFRADVPSFLWVDEAWTMLMHSRFGRQFAEWSVELRKYNVWLLLALQSPVQLMELDPMVRDVVLEACRTMVFLPNSKALEPSVAEVYRAVGLNDAEIQLIAEAEAKRQYYVKNELGGQLFDLSLGPVELALMTPRSGMDAEALQRHVRDLQGRFGRDWVAEYMREAGLNGAADEFLGMEGRDDAMAA
ncbi:MAG TPA: hypothetical protein VF263_08620 [Longimicrobiaceae bacterium]